MVSTNLINCCGGRPDIPIPYILLTELNMTEWKSVKTEDELFTARLPQVYLMRKDCVSIKLKGSRWEIDELSSTPPHHTPSLAPTDHPYTLS